MQVRTRIAHLAILVQQSHLMGRPGLKFGVFVQLQAQQREALPMPFPTYISVMMPKEVFSNTNAQQG